MGELRQCVILGFLHPPNGRSGLELRDAAAADVERMATLHADRLPQGFFVRLGPRYLRAYHRTFIGNDLAVALVAEEDRSLVGFVVGPVDAAAHRQFVIRRHGWRLALAGAGALLFRPALALEFGRTRLGRYARGLVRALRRTPSLGPTSPGGLAPERTAVLSHVAVDASSASRGVGRALVGGYVEAVRRRGARRVELVTLAGDEGAGGFYRRLGWQESGGRAAGGAAFERFVLELQ